GSVRRSRAHPVGVTPRARFAPCRVQSLLMYIRFVTLTCHMPICNTPISYNPSHVSQPICHVLASPAVALPQSPRWPPRWPPRWAGHEHAQDPPRRGAAVCLHSPSGRQQIALSDGFLDAKNPDPTTRFPTCPLQASRRPGASCLHSLLTRCSTRSSSFRLKSISCLVMCRFGASVTTFL